MLLAAVAVLASVGPALAQSPAATPAQLEQARRILRTTPLVDGHNDLPWEIRTRFAGRIEAADLGGDTRGKLHTDIARLRRGGVGGQFWSVYIPADLSGPAATQAVMEQIDIVRRMVALHPGAFELATTAADVERVQKAGRIASLIGLEGGYGIADNLAVLRGLHAEGVRYITLTHSKTTSWADSATDAPRHGGLSPFGEAVVREMNRLGVLVDLSHVSEETMVDAMRVSEAPVIFSHSSARAVNGHPRNVPDGVLRLLPADGGVVMVNFYPVFVSEPLRRLAALQTAEAARLGALHPGDPDRVKRELAAWTAAQTVPQATLAEVADHLEHIRRAAGVDHVGIGSDFDGVPSLPEGLGGVETYPALLAELLRRGWSEADVRKLAGGNILRVMRAAESTAARLQRTTAPSMATIAELDGPGKR
jgi:membrane dipeptidase